MEHTPTPWEAVAYTLGTREPDDGRRIQSKEKSTPSKAYNIAFMARRDGHRTEEVQANAALIVQAVNAHDKLVTIREIAERALAFMPQGQPETRQLQRAIIDLDAIWPEGSIHGKVTAAIKLARGE